MRFQCVGGSPGGGYQKNVGPPFPTPQKVPFLFGNACTALELLLVMMVANGVFGQHVVQLFPPHQVSPPKPDLVRQMQCFNTGAFHVPVL